MEHHQNTSNEERTRRVPWNKGKIVGAKPPLQPSHVWSIRTKLQMESKTRDLALFNLAIDSKLRGCDLVELKIGDLVSGPEIKTRATHSAKDRAASPVRDSDRRAGRPVCLAGTERR